MIKYEKTDYGFKYGSCEIERTCSDAKKGWVDITLTTPKFKQGIQIYVTKTGKVRFIDNENNQEWCRCDDLFK